MIVGRLVRLTGEQVRAGRAFIRAEQADLAQAAQLSIDTIKRLERTRGPVEATFRTMHALIEAFAARGVCFDAREDGSVGVTFVEPSDSDARSAQAPALKLTA